MTGRQFAVGAAVVLALLDLQGDKAALILTGAIAAVIGIRILKRGR